MQHMKFNIHMHVKKTQPILVKFLWAYQTLFFHLEVWNEEVIIAVNAIYAIA